MDYNEKMTKTKRKKSLPSNLRRLISRLIGNPNYEGNACKLYANRGNVLFGNGAFLEYVAKGNKQRIIVDQSTGFMYVTLDHHKTYFEVE